MSIALAIRSKQEDRNVSTPIPILLCFSLNVFFSHAVRKLNGFVHLRPDIVSILMLTYAY